MRREVQVRQAGAGVQARRKPNLRADKTLELAPESVGAATAEGNGEGPAAAIAPSATSAEHDVRCSIQR